MDNIYYEVLEVIVRMILRHGASLGLMSPASPEQLEPVGIPSYVVINGMMVHRAVVKIFGNKIQSKRDFQRFKQAVQEALDDTCYSLGLARLYLCRATPLHGKQVGLELVIGEW